MPEMHLRQPGFTFSAYGPFPKNKERIKKRLIELIETLRNCPED